MKGKTTSVLALSLTTSVFLLLCGCNAGAPSGSGGGQDSANEADGAEGGQIEPDDGDNEPDAASGGSVVNAVAGSLVTLRPGGGTLGSDVSCRWRQIDGPVTLDLDEADVSSCELQFRPTTPGTYLFEVMTTDSTGRSETETVTLHVGEGEFPTGAPIAVAGDDQIVGEGTPVTLDGGRSRDPDGDALSYAWRQVGGVEASLSSHFVPDPTFTAPLVDRDTDLVFELAVSDGALGSSDSCVITVLDRGVDPGDDVDPGDGPVEPECAEEGAACTANEDCCDDLVCGADGMCAAAVVECDPPCAADEVCEDSVCVPAVEECESDDDCPDDDLHCNGTESCDLTADPPVCVSSGDPCAAHETCNEDNDECVAPECTTDGDCDDTLYCNGEETCNSGTGLCQAGTSPCNPMTETCTECVSGGDCVPSPSGVMLLFLGEDDLTGTAEGDSFSAPLICGHPSLQTGDQVDGWPGDDLLEASFDGTSATPTIVNIETISLTASAPTTLSARNINGAFTVNSVNSTALMTVSNLSELVDAGITNTSAGLTVKFTAGATSGGADAMTWTVSGVTGGNAVVESAGANGLETINITSTGGTANTLASLTQLNGTSLTHLNFFGSQDLTVSALPGTLCCVDALSFAASLSIDASGSSVPMDIWGGTGHDTLLSGSAGDIIQGDGGNDTINGGSGGDLLYGGAGKDAIVGGSGADSIWGGGGNDTFVFASGNLTTTPDTITDFSLGTDKIQFAGVDDVGSDQQVAVQNGVNALPPGAPPAMILDRMDDINLTDFAVSVAAKDGKTYVLLETTGADDFETNTDVFIQLNGVSSGFTFAGDVIP